MTNNSEQLSLINEQPKADHTLTICLGMTFENEEARREYFREELRKKLPELKQIEGFPIGEDEDIVALSDPPYYTACPNPWINDFIQEWENEKRIIYSNNPEITTDREPYVFDISEGKSDVIYNAHTYHTKVPPKAILRYLLHYTNPGDIIFDGFSGTGMTGVAANMCNSKDFIRQIGYSVDEKLNIIDPSTNNVISKLGNRKVVLGDLSPIATFISKNYNTPLDALAFKKEALSIINSVERKLGWMYKTKDEDGKEFNMSYMVWSDIFACPHCDSEFVFHDVATNPEDGKVLDEFYCPECNSKLNKKSLQKVWESKLDSITGEIIKQTKSTPVLVCYKENRRNKLKKINNYDSEILKKVEDYEITQWVPSDRMPEGDEARRNDRTGITNVHHFYTKRNLVILSEIHEEILKSNYRDSLLLLFTSHLINLSKLNRYRPGVSFPYNPLSGTLYIGSQITESNIFEAYRNKVDKITNAFFTANKNVAISVQSQTNISLEDNSIDYVFTDPPFGANIMYSELSFIWESWLTVKTNITDEAIINNTQSKKLRNYQQLMEESFKEYYRVLKPGRWITIEFSNSKASVWNALQNALGSAGFIVANVSILDKQLGSFKAVTTTTAVKQDLVISAYKPLETDTERIKLAFSVESCWRFIEQHLRHLPLFSQSQDGNDLVPERTPRILFDRMVAYHVQNGLSVPVSSADFQQEIAKVFVLRDGMVFLNSQVSEYDKRRSKFQDVGQISLFVSDENSAIEWLRQMLLKKPQTRQDLHPQFLKEIQHIAKHEQLPELDDLLTQNFLCYEGGTVVPDQIAGYLRRNYHEYRGLDNENGDLKSKSIHRWYVPDSNKQADLEKMRERALLHEFEIYVEELGTHKKKLRQFRTEAIRAGFKKAWTEKDYIKIVNVGDRLPETVIQEDDKLLMYYDNAQIRIDM